MDNNFNLKKGDRVRHNVLCMTGIVMTVGPEKWLMVRSNDMVFNWSGHDLEKLDVKPSRA